ncbi:MAG: DUF4345 family protein [Myxococcales bacterium]|nr:DUF4345 family protein [Myxococcales bacterium]
MPSIVDLVIALLASGFALMGVGALAAPALVTRQFGLPDLGIDARNEVRAVYGGFGVVVAIMLAVGLLRPELRAGICLTVGVALGGMASGRIVSAAVDRSLGRVPAAYLLLESLGAVALVCAA